LPGLQYIISRIISISSPRVGLSIMDSHALEVNDVRRPSGLGFQAATGPQDEFVP